MGRARSISRLGSSRLLISEAAEMCITCMPPASKSASNSHLAFKNCGTLCGRAMPAS